MSTGYTPAHECLFPKCDEPAVENHKCVIHQRVTISAHWAPNGGEAEAGDY